MRKAKTLGISLAVRFEIGGPEGTCTLLAVRRDPSRRQRASPLIELLVRNGGNAGNGAFARAVIAELMVALRKQFSAGQP